MGLLLHYKQIHVNVIDKHLAAVSRQRAACGEWTHSMCKILESFALGNIVQFQPSNLQDNLKILLLHHCFCQLSFLEKKRLMEFNKVRERLTEHFIGAEVNRSKSEALLNRIVLGYYALHCACWHHCNQGYHFKITSSTKMLRLTAALLNKITFVNASLIQNSPVMLFDQST